MEPLEDRRLLAVLTVMNLGDLPNVASAGALGPLPHAIYEDSSPSEDGALSVATGAAGPAADLVLNDVVFVDAFGADTTTPVVGQRVYVRAEWTFSDLDAADQYLVRFDMDGVPVESYSINGWAGTNVPYSWWQGSWLATPGVHTITVTVDADNTVSEINEANNTISFQFTPVAPSLAPTFSWPLGGVQSEDWVVEGYLDTDARPGFANFADYQGRGATYDGHNGIDIAIANFAAMDAGVPVYAAAGGTVVEADDGHFDRWLAWQSPEPPVNYVVIDHGNGWTTRYLHLRRDSVSVSVGDVVTAGQQIGMVGASGLAARAHLHFEVLHNDTPVEPFIAPTTYFASPPVYTFDAPKKLLDMGITNVPPTFEDIAEHVSDVDGFPVTGNYIYLQAWAIFASLEAGDTWEVQLFRPNGTLYSDYDPITVADDGAWQWSYWYGDLPPTPDAGNWRADWIINGSVVAQQYYAVGTALPEIRVSFTDGIIIDGRTTPIDFGTADVGGAGGSVQFTVANHGYAPLAISGVDLPAGYTLAEPLDSTIATGLSDTFTVELDTSAPGLRAGQIVIHSDDVSEPATTFAVEGLVTNALPGDYNLDGIVDAGDYSVWRDALGDSVSPYSGADGDGNGTIDENDYDVWKSNFGSTLPPGSGAVLVATTSGDVGTAPSAVALSAEPAVASAPVAASQPAAIDHGVTFADASDRPSPIDLLGVSQSSGNGRVAASASVRSPVVMAAGPQDEAVALLTAERSGGAAEHRENILQDLDAPPASGDGADSPPGAVDAIFERLGADSGGSNGRLLIA